MSDRFILPQNLGQLGAMANAFLLAAEQATNDGMLSRTFTHNVNLLGININHLLAMVVIEIDSQNDTKEYVHRQMELMLK